MLKERIDPRAKKHVLRNTGPHAFLKFQPSKSSRKAWSKLLADPRASSSQPKIKGALPNPWGHSPVFEDMAHMLTREQKGRAALVAKKRLLGKEALRIRTDFRLRVDMGSVDPKDLPPTHSLFSH